MIIGVDVDEVIAKLHEAWIDAYNLGEGTSVPLSAFDTWHIESKFPTIFDYLTPELYDHVQPYLGTRDTVRTLQAIGHTIIFVSACGKHNEFAPAKLRWLRRWAFIRPGQPDSMLLAGRDKRHAPVDVLVDDHIKNVESFVGARRDGSAILVTRNHNRTLPTEAPRIPGLGEIYYLLGPAPEPYPTA